MNQPRPPGPAAPPSRGRRRALVRLARLAGVVELGAPGRLGPLGRITGLALTGGGGLAAAPLQAAERDGPDAMYEMLGKMPKTRRELAGGTLDIVFAPDIDAAQRPALLGWVDGACRAIVTYFGRFPVRSAGLLIEPQPGRRVGHGTSWGYAGSAIRVQVGSEAEAATFADDWVLVHEMVHLAFPTVARRHLWIEEGSATYVEPIARAMVGQMSAAEVWLQFVRSMPQGQPAPGDAGLDRTPTWGRTYWGGALFCLLADVEARKRTDNRRGLVDALRAIAAASGGNAARWPLERALSVGDAAIGAPVLAGLYAQHREQALRVDLGALFASLGVVAAADSVRFDASAPLAAAREAIMRAPGA